MINLSTGPVNFHPKVKEALVTPPISHRSKEFKRLHHSFVDFICEKLNISTVALMQGSGTLANEAMLHQIKSHRTNGIILSNGEFGDRLIEQANRLNLDFTPHTIPWGQRFDISEIAQKIGSNLSKWILFAHCETSTGVVNDMQAISTLAAENGIDCYADCMSSVGVMEVDLSKMTMATCSSGKGLASMAGIAMVLSNSEFAECYTTPKYLDLTPFNQNILPFTLASNLLQALAVSAEGVINPSHWEKKQELAQSLISTLQPMGCIPFADSESRVFTIFNPNVTASNTCNRLLKLGVELSHESSYLQTRNWFQLALLGNISSSDFGNAKNQLVSELEQQISI